MRDWISEVMVFLGACLSFTGIVFQIVKMIKKIIKEVKKNG